MKHYIEDHIFNMDCSICRRKTNHTTEKHRCGRCDGLGHGANSHCELCGVFGHKKEDHTCKRNWCRLYEEHIHPCDYCLEEHQTKEHICYKCDQKGHDGSDHYKKAYCIACKLYGHTAKDTHFDCTYCKNRLINVEHLWCEHCSSCMFQHRPHKGICEYCGGCMALEQENYEPELRCIKCYCRRGNPDAYDITEGAVYGYL